MDRETWERIKDITADALDITAPAERAAFIDEACARDEEVRSEVLRMVASYEVAEESFLEPPRFDIKEVIRKHIEAGRTFQEGQLINGRFRITRFLNEGGMGEVFEAWDTDLQESIALKTIRPGIAPHPSVIERFKREVKQARSITHPNICPVYELFPALLDSGEEVWFLSMKLLPGETLAQRLARSGPLPLAEALPMALQLISALAAAHATGIVHSDFKSSNIMLVSSTGGTIAVVTDFGLSFNLAQAPDEHYPKPGEGTAAYLAPERVQGLALNPASDQYALGVVLCEMVTGQRPHPTMPVIQDRRWRKTILRCIHPDPAQRFASVAQVAEALQPKSRRLFWPRLLAATGIALALVIAFAVPRRQEQIQDLTLFTSGTDLSGSPSFSYDGKTLAYMSDRAEQGNEDIWIQRLDGSNPRRLTVDPAEDGEPDLSPDGRLVAFHSKRKDDGVYVVPASGGAARLLSLHGRDPRFSPDGRSILYWKGDADERVAGAGLYVIPATGGPPQRLVPQFADARNPVWHSEGRRILFQGCREMGPNFPDCSEWWALNLEDGRVHETGAFAALKAADVELFAPATVWQGERVLFSARSSNATNIYSVGISPRTLRLTSPVKPITSGENTRDISPTLTRNGQIAIGRLSGAIHIWNVPLRTSAPLKVTNDAALDTTPYVSPNGRWLVFSRGRRKPSQLWVKDLQTGTEEILFTSSVHKLAPLISNSGRTVVFEQQDSSGTSVRVATRGAADSRLLCAGCANPSAWIEDDRLIAANQTHKTIVALDTRTGASHPLLTASGMHLDAASWSSQHRLLAFTAAHNNRKQIFVAPIASLSPVSKEHWVPITVESEWNDKPTWSLDGSSLYYISSRDGFQCIWSQPFNPQTRAASGPPVVAVHLHNQRLSPMRLTSMHFRLTAAPEALYFNLGEASETIWTGTLGHRNFFSYIQHLLGE